MKNVHPYTEVNEALKSLDNGGRFYNLLTQAEDGVISQAELGKTGGLFSDIQRMILFLEVSISKLNQDEKDLVVSKLDDDLKANYLKYKTQHLLPSEVEEQGIVSSNLILTGVPKLIDSKSDFNGFIMVPNMVGGVTTFSLIPLIDQYDVYELRDEQTSESFIIAHSKTSEKLPNKKIIVAGVLKTLETDKTVSKPRFLETLYTVQD
ncbi:conserved hypothetical protein [Formosa agariphila KMM 3901]|uniref:Uncharacterized protein n=1 Tax=Formosa agariphila (strain DSM 15362 / KCTC 12365 / LMG 23005 / KMM 3901 / M-2Alg 35-1) TaxID=1347342 RepID=T2KM07_FORAG|nr:hypothetical protein [Formosa agariphila]CDF79498.1 conserved hypothetical protein [Formosa agariphila KMM 3901]